MHRKVPPCQHRLTISDKILTHDKAIHMQLVCCNKACVPNASAFQLSPRTGVKLDGKSIWKIHMDFFSTNPFFLNLFKYIIMSFDTFS